MEYYIQVAVHLALSSPFLKGTVARYIPHLDGYNPCMGMEKSFAGSIKPGNFLVYMVAMPSAASPSHALSASSFSLRILLTPYTYETEKRDINSIVFAQRCPVFHFPAPIFDAPVFHSPPRSCLNLPYLPPMTASTRSCVAGSESTLDWRFSTTSAGAGAEEVWIGSAVACA